MLAELGVVEQRYKAVPEVHVDGTTCAEPARAMGTAIGRGAVSRDCAPRHA